MEVEAEPRRRASTATRRRWLIRVLLIVGFPASALSPVFLSRRYLGPSGTTDHAVVSLVVPALALVHLWQRRHTVKRLATQLLRPRHARSGDSFQAESNLMRWILTLNAMVSGVADYLVGRPIYLRVLGPFILQKWHAMSALVLLAYVITHVIRRRRRLRLSHIT